MVKGVKSEDVLNVLESISIAERKKVKEISVDMANNMEKIARLSFPNAAGLTYL